MSEKVRAVPGDALWTPEKQRCWDVMAQFARGVHHMGKVYHWGNGLRMSWLAELATFDGSDLTYLVVLAHHHLCRCSVSSSGPRRVAIEVFARKPEGRLCKRHPGLSDLVSQCQRLSGAGAGGVESDRPAAEAAALAAVDRRVRQ